jgi:hypothetical protein
MLARSSISVESVTVLTHITLAVSETIQSIQKRLLKLGLQALEITHQPPPLSTRQGPAKDRNVKVTNAVVEVLTPIKPLRCRGIAGM